MSATGSSTVDVLIAHAKSRLAGFTVLEPLHVVAELHRNASGTLLKRLVREQFATLATARSTT